MAKFVICNSGGLDSAFLAAKYDQLGHEVHSIHIDARQAAQPSSRDAAAITASNWCESHKLVTVDLGQTVSYWQPYDEVLGWNGPYEMFDTVDPIEREARRLAGNPPRAMNNLSMFIVSIAITYAKMIGAPKVITGHRLERGEAFITQYNDVMNLNAAPVSRPETSAPMLLVRTYRDVAIGLLGEPLTQAKIDFLITTFSYTHSCNWNDPCGLCPKCVQRIELGLPA